MAGEPAPLAAVQAAVLKTAAGKQAQSGDVPAAGSSQATAVAQDLAVMADQAKGYAAGVNQGVIVAQDNRAAQARRLAEEAAQAQAARARQLQLEQMQTERMRLSGEAAAQQDRFATEREYAQQANARRAEEESGPSAEDEARAASVFRHAAMNRGPKFNAALGNTIPAATNPEEAVALLRNAQRHPEDFPWAVGIKEETLRRYAQQYFRALEGKAVSARRLDDQKRPASATRTNGGTSARPQGTTESDAVIAQYRAAGGGSGAGWMRP